MKSHMHFFFDSSFSKKGVLPEVPLTNMTRLAMGAQLMQQATGINVALFYAPTM